MTREEFNIALDMALTKDKVQLCLEYTNEVEDRTCESCTFYEPLVKQGTLFKRCMFLGTVGDL